MVFIIYKTHIYYKKPCVENWCILLTTCVNKKRGTPAYNQKMLKHYTNIIYQWLETGLPIFVVESSNYRFDEISHQNLIVYSFLDETYLSSSVSEVTSILRILDNVPEINLYSHILKVTGRYYISNIYKHLTNVGCEGDLYIQHLNNNKDFQNSEVFGFRRRLTDIIFKQVLNPPYPLIEHQLWNISHENNYKIVVLPKMPNTDLIPRGGDGLTLPYL